MPGYGFLREAAAASMDLFALCRDGFDFEQTQSGILSNSL